MTEALISTGARSDRNIAFIDATTGDLMQDDGTNQLAVTPTWGLETVRLRATWSPSSGMAITVLNEAKDDYDEAFGPFDGSWDPDGVALRIGPGEQNVLLRSAGFWSADKGRAWRFEGYAPPSHIEPIYVAPLDLSLAPTVGTQAVTFTRASVARHVNQDLVPVEVPADEPRFIGAQYNGGWSAGSATDADLHGPLIEPATVYIIRETDPDLPNTTWARSRMYASGTGITVGDVILRAFSMGSSDDGARYREIHYSSPEATPAAGQRCRFTIVLHSPTDTLMGFSISPQSAKGSGQFINTLMGAFDPVAKAWNWAIPPVSESTVEISPGVFQADLEFDWIPKDPDNVENPEVAYFQLTIGGDPDTQVPWDGAARVQFGLLQLYATDGHGPLSWYLWMDQNAQALRPLDNLSLPNVGLNDTEGCIALEVYQTGVPNGDMAYAAVGDQPTARPLYYDAASGVVASTDGTNTVLGEALPIGVRTKMAIAWDASGIRLVINGNVYTSGAYAGGFGGTGDIQFLGSPANGDAIPGGIRNVQIFDQRPTDAHVDELGGGPPSYG